MCLEIPNTVQIITKYNAVSCRVSCVFDDVWPYGLLDLFFRTAIMTCSQSLSQIIVSVSFEKWNTHTCQKDIIEIDTQGKFQEFFLYNDTSSFITNVLGQKQVYIFKTNVKL